MTIRQIGIDIGKNTFHVIGLGAESGIELRKLFTRSQLLRFFEGQSGEALNVAFEACSGVCAGSSPIVWGVDYSAKFQGMSSSMSLCMC